jgi:hypothetical protein
VGQGWHLTSRGFYTVAQKSLNKLEMQLKSQSTAENVTCFVWQANIRSFFACASDDTDEMCVPGTVYWPNFL